MTFLGDIHIERSVREVFAYFIDTDNLPNWVGGFQSLEVLTEGEIDVGGRSKQVVRQQGVDLHFIQEITGYEPNSLFEATMVGKELSVSVRYDFLDNGDGTTTLKMEQRVRLKALWLRAAKRLVKPMMEKAQREDLERFRDILEGNG